MWIIFKKRGEGTNEQTYKTKQRHGYRKQTDVTRDKLEAWDSHTDTTIYEIDNYQEPAGIVNSTQCSVMDYMQRTFKKKKGDMW